MPWTHFWTSCFFFNVMGSLLELMGSLLDLLGSLLELLGSLFELLGSLLDILLLQKQESDSLYTFIEHSSSFVLSNQRIDRSRNQPGKDVTVSSNKEQENS